jgi:hypothetical protein
MDQTSIVHQQAKAAEGRREALKWLARRLNWERRLGQLRSDEATSPESGESKQAA